MSDPTELVAIPADIALELAQCLPDRSHLVCALGLLALVVFLNPDPAAGVAMDNNPAARANLSVNGFEFMVETSTHPDASLLIWPARRDALIRIDDATILVAARIEAHTIAGARVRLLGWLTTQEFHRLARRAANNPGRAPKFVSSFLAVDQLMPMHALRLPLTKPLEVKPC